VLVMRNDVVCITVNPEPSAQTDNCWFSLHDKRTVTIVTGASVASTTAS
jgi:hypothetical protein